SPSKNAVPCTATRQMLPSSPVQPRILVSRMLPSAPRGGPVVSLNAPEAAEAVQLTVTKPESVLELLRKSCSGAEAEKCRPRLTVNSGLVLMPNASKHWLGTWKSKQSGPWYSLT